MSSSHPQDGGEVRYQDYRPPDRRPWWERCGRLHPAWALVGLVWLCVLEAGRFGWWVFAGK